MRDKADLYSPVIKNDRFGFFQLKPAYRKIMQNFYEDEYYQNNYAHYRETEYDDFDLEYKNNCFAQKLYIWKKYGGGHHAPLFLDIGCGEGYMLNFFKSAGWAVTGIDLSSFGLKQHNPSMEKYLLKGDVEKIVINLKNKEMVFDFINADYVLEHIPDPERFFLGVKCLCHKDTILCITVPNDYSVIQLLSYEMDMIDTPFWVSMETSEHFNYFSHDSLTSLGEGMGFRKVMALSDWPIDFFLLHPKTNYRNDSSVGSDCHKACVMLENIIYNKSFGQAINLFQTMAKMGIGRALTVYFKLK